MEQPLLLLCLAFTLAVLALLLRQDWPHLTRPRHRATGIVASHRAYRDEGTRSFAAVIHFTAPDGRSVDVEDQLLGALPHPAVGSSVTLRYPEGRPDLARIPRPWLRAAIYGLVLALAALLIARLLGWLPAGGDVAGL